MRFKFNAATDGSAPWQCSFMCAFAAGRRAKLNSKHVQCDGTTFSCIHVGLRCIFLLSRLCCAIFFFVLPILLPH